MHIGCAYTISGFELSTISEMPINKASRFSGCVHSGRLLYNPSLDFVEKKENIIFLGPPGVGKTHLSIALGIKACMAKYRVGFVTVQKLLEELLLSAKDGSLLDKLLGYSRLNLLIIDELGYMPVTKEQANLLFRLVSMRYEKGSIILTSNYNFDEWGEIFSDHVVAAAIIDRLVHHAHIFYINGTSYRLKGKLRASTETR
jgi:DNA replication protein DnaC